MCLGFLKGHVGCTHKLYRTLFYIFFHNFLKHVLKHQDHSNIFLNIFGLKKGDSKLNLKQF